MKHFPATEQRSVVDLNSHAPGLGELTLEYLDNQNISADSSLLFIHGLADCKEDALIAFGHTEAAHYRIVSVDLLGHGKSSKPESFDYGLEAQAEALSQLIRLLNLSNVHIIAHSIGGAIGVLLAEQVKSRLASLITIEGNLVASDCGIITRKTCAVSLEEYADTGHPARRARLEEQRRSTYAHDAVTATAFYRSAQSTVMWSDSNKLIEIFLGLPCAKTYLYGERNSGYPVIGQLQKVPLIEISRSGHRPMDENPKEHFDKVFAFVQMHKC